MLKLKMLWTGLTLSILLLISASASADPLTVLIGGAAQQAAWIAANPGVEVVTWMSDVALADAAMAAPGEVLGPMNQLWLYIVEQGVASGEVGAVVNAGGGAGTAVEVTELTSAGVGLVDGTGAVGGTLTGGTVTGGTVTGGAALVGGAVVIVSAGVAIYLADDYLQNTTGTLLNPGSQPADNLTDYENPANYWTQFRQYYGF